MRTTNAINFYCRESKCNKKGYSPIEMSLIINGKRVFLNLPRKEKPKEFIKETQKRSSELLDYLNEIRRITNNAQTQLMRDGLPITVNNIREYIQVGGIKSYTLEMLFDEFMEMTRLRVGVDLAECTYQKYEIVQKEFLEFIPKETEISCITTATISRFYVELNKVNKISTTAAKMTKLKTVFKYAFESGKTPIFPFSSVKIKKGTPNVEYLTRDELRRIMNHKWDNERLEHVADIFIFQASSGLSYADMERLSLEDIKEHEGVNYIRKERVKTGIEYTAIVLPEGMKILHKYNGTLPIFSNQKYNAYLKEIADLCHIQKNIHTHMARKSYATMLLNSGISITTVSKMLGHTNSLITQKHYAKVLDETIFEEIHKMKKKQGKVE